MLPGPVFNVELITLARRGRYFLLRTIYGALLLFFIWSNLPGVMRDRAVAGEVSIQQAASIGQTLFATFMGVQTFAVLLLTPALVAGTIADERQRKTLHYLLASRLTSAEIVLGKLCARGLHLAVFLAAGLPILVMISFFGGVDPNVVLLLFGGSLTSAFFLASLAIYASTRARRPREAVSMSYIGMLGWLFGPNLFLAMTPGPENPLRPAFDLAEPVVEFVGQCSPFYTFVSQALRGFGRGASPAQAVFTMMGLQVAFGLFFCLWAVARIRPSFRREGSTRSPASLRRLAGLRLLRRPDCGDDAMLWKELHVSKSSPMMRLATGLAFVGVLGLMVFGASYVVPDAIREVLSQGYSSDGAYAARGELNVYLRIVMTLLSICILLGVASAASASLTGEREEDTWISLISTPLTADEIVRAKWVGSIWSLRPAYAVWGALLLLGLVLGAVHPFGLVASVAFLAVYSVSVCALGVFFSLRSRTSSRSLLATVGTLLMLNVGYLLILSPILALIDLGSVELLGMAPLFLGASPMSYQDVAQSLRGSGPDSDLFVAGLASLLLYGLLALGSAYLTLRTFDALNDRPPSTGRPGRRGAEQPAPIDDEPDPEPEPDAAAVEAPESLA